MRADNVAEVRPAVDIDQVKRRAVAQLIKVQDAERAEEAAAEQHEKRRDVAARERLALGKILIEARKAWPARGPKAKGWGDFLADLGVEQQRASELMRWAGYVEEISPPSARGGENYELPTYAEAGVKKQADSNQRLPALATQSLNSVVSENWAEDMETLAQQMVRAAKTIFSAAEQLDALCRQRQAAVSAMQFAAIPTHLLSAQAAIASTLRLFKGELP